MDFRFQISDWKAWPLLRIRCSRLLIALCVMCFGISLRAADITVGASLSESSTEVGQPVQLQIKISGARNATPPERIDVRGLDINYSGQSTQVQMNNFNVTMSVVHSYTVVPQRAGTFVIPGLEVAVDGKRLVTAPVTLNVGTSASATGGTSNARLAFSELVVPKQNAYVGEAIPVEFRIYVDARVRWQTNEQPTIPGEGFTIQKLTAPTQNQTQRDGRQYDLVTFKTAITPVKTGKLKLGPAEIHCVAQLPRQRQPHLGGFDDFFNDPFGAFAQTQQMTIKSEPVEFEVRPLPGGQPASFSGAVGQFTLSAQASPTKVRAGDPITVTLKVTGRGNFDRVSAPQMVVENGWRGYPPSARFQADDDIGISGAKTFEMAVIPDEKKTTLPEIEFSYFDPVAEKYVTRHSDREPINVEAGSAPPVAKATPEPASQPAQTPPAARIADDIQYIRTDSGKWGESFEPIYRNRNFWVAQIVPLLALLGFVGFQVQRTRRNDGRAAQLAEWHREQGELMKTMKRNDVDYTAFFDAATKYIQIETSLRTGRNPTSISADDVLNAITLDPETVNCVQSIFNASAELRYAGTAHSNGRLTAERRDNVLEAIRKIENANA